MFTSGEEYKLGSNTLSPVGSWFTPVVVFDKVGGTLSAYRDGVTSASTSGKDNVFHMNTVHYHLQACVLDCCCASYANHIQIFRYIIKDTCYALSPKYTCLLHFRQ